MVKQGLVLFICFITLNSYAQFDGKGEYEVSRFRPGAMWSFTGYRPAKPGKPNKYDRLIFDVTYNDWTGEEDLFKNSWASIGLNTNLMFDVPLTEGNTIALGIGVSHQYTNVRHDNKFIIDEVENTSIYTLKDTSDLFKKGTFRIPELN